MYRNSIQYLLLIFACTFSLNLFATHAKTAEIIYKHIDGFTYEISIITLTLSFSPADRPELQINWGDGTIGIITRSSSTIVLPETKKNYYTSLHTFPGEGSYLLSMEDPNRNWGIANIPYSVNEPLYVESLLVIDNELGPNNSPEFLISPFTVVMVNNPFHYNGGAIDWDGDLLTYQLVDCKGSNGEPIPGYFLPESTNEFSINNESGQILWDEPFIQGEYIIAVKTTEWRKGNIIGFVVREYQFFVDSDSPDVPEIISINDTSIYYNQVLDFNVLVQTESGTEINLNAYGYPLLIENQPAEFDSVSGIGNCSSLFHWETNSLHARAQSYFIYLASTSIHPYFGTQSTIVYPVKIDVNFYEDIIESDIRNPTGVSMNTIVDQKLFLKFTEPVSGNIAIKIFSLSGSCVAQFSSKNSINNSLEIDLSNLNTALYLVNIENDNNIIYSGKVFKQ